MANDHSCESRNDAAHDALTFALRLVVEREESHAPETLEALERWKPAIYAVLEGKSRDEAIRCVVSETGDKA